MIEEKCKSCGAPIFYAALAPKGAITPIDWFPVINGNIACRMVKGEPHARVIKKDEDYQGNRRTSHFATCPDAKAWRKGGGKK